MESTPSELENREAKLDEAAACYFELLNSGRPFDPEHWLAQYPDLEDELRDFLGDLKGLNPASSGSTKQKPNSQRFEALSRFLRPSSKPGSMGTLGHYEVLKLLGQGGFGVVFKAFDEKLHRLVAIKTMDQQLASTSPPRKRFLREARSVAAIKNDNIVQVYSVEEHPLPYLVMEFVDGATLQEKLDDSGPIDVRELLHLARQMASGLAAAHAQGLIHRDIKPGNILIEAGVEQKIKITDFGLARAADDASLTQSGMICGTPLYMAPEQALGQELDQRTDLFSLGSVMYQMACGRPPFRAPTTLAVMRRVTDDTPRPLQEILPGIPDWLVVIINRLLEKKPEDRFQTSKETAGLLAKCQSELLNGGQVTCIDCSHLALRNAASSASATVVSVPPHQSAPAATKSPVTAAPGMTSFGKNRGLLVTGVIAALAIATVFLLNGRRNNQTENLVSGGGQPSEKSSAISNPESQKSNLATGGQDGPTPAADAGEKTPLAFQTPGFDKWMKEVAALPAEQQAEAVSKKLVELNPGFDGKLHDFQSHGVTAIENGVVTSFGFPDNNVADISPVRAMVGLKALYIDGSGEGKGQLTDLSPLQGMPLTKLFLTGTSVSDAGLEQLKGLTNLTGLQLSGTQVTDAGLEHLKGLTKLTGLQLGLTRVTDVGLQHIKGLTSLTGIQLAPRVSDAGLEHLKGLTNLTQITFGNAQITDVGLEHLKGLINLTGLQLEGSQVSDAGLEHLEGLTNLASLQLENTRVSDAGLAHILQGPHKLKYLNLGGTQVTDAGLVHLSGQTNLSELRLHNTKVSDARLEQLVSLPNLTFLGLTNTRISAKGFAALKAAFPKAVIGWSEPNRIAAEAVLALGGTVHIRLKGQQDDQPVKAAANLPAADYQVTRVSLAGVQKPLNAVWATLMALSDPRFDHLDSIDLSGAAVSDNYIPSLKSMPSLTELSLTGTSVTDAGLAQFKDLKSLRRLVLDGSPIRGPGLTHLKDLPELTELSLACPTLSDLFATRLSELQQVQKLSLAGSGLTDEALPSLIGLTNLQELDLSGTKLTASGIATLQAALTKCKIVSEVPGARP